MRYNFSCHFKISLQSLSNILLYGKKLAPGEGTCFESLISLEMRFNWIVGFNRSNQQKISHRRLFNLDCLNNIR